jgi:hypothetical protein
MSKKWNCPIDLKNTKINLSGLSEDVKKKFQECCFEQGIKWDAIGDDFGHLEFGHYGTSLYSLRYWSHPKDPGSSFEESTLKNITTKWLDWHHNGTEAPNGFINEVDHIPDVKQKVYALGNIKEAFNIFNHGDEVEYYFGYKWHKGFIVCYKRGSEKPYGVAEEENCNSYSFYSQIREPQPPKYKEGSVYIFDNGKKDKRLWFIQRHIERNSYQCYYIDYKDNDLGDPVLCGRAVLTEGLQDTGLTFDENVVFKDFAKSYFQIEEPKILEDRIKEAYPDFEVVMLQRTKPSNCLKYKIPRKAGEDQLYVYHVIAQSENDFAGYVYEYILSNELKDYPLPSIKGDCGDYHLPVAWLRKKS